MDFLWPLLLGAVAVLGLTVVPRAQARRRRAALTAGGAATFRVRLAGTTAPYPQSPRRGVMRITTEQLTWTARGGGSVLDLTAAGLRPTGLREPRPGEGGGQNELVLTAADAVGVAVRLVGLAGTVQNLREMLSERAAPTAPGPAAVLQPGGRRSLLLLPAAVLLLALLGGTFTGWSLTTGAFLTGTVVSTPDVDGYCDVRWTDPRDNSEHVNGIDCYDDVGDQVPLVALAGPLRGEVVASDDPWFWAVISGSLAVSAIWWGLWRVRARRRDAAARAAPTAPVAPAPVLGENELDYSSVVAATRARAAADGWEFDAPERASAGGSGLSSAGGALAAAIRFSLWPILVAAVVALIVGWTPLAGMWSSLDDTARATATVTDEPFETLPFAPEDLEIRFRLPNGHMQTTLVAVRGLPEPIPTTVDVEYSVADPHRARAVTHDGAPFGAALAGGILLIGMSVASWRLWPVLAVRRAQRRALRHGRHLLRYVLTPTLDGTCLLLLYRDGMATRPAFLVELADDLLGSLPGTGTVELHGKMAPGEVVVARTEGTELLLTSPLLDIEPAETAHLVNGTGSATA